MGRKFNIGDKVKLHENSFDDLRINSIKERGTYKDIFGYKYESGKTPPLGLGCSMMSKNELIITHFPFYLPNNEKEYICMYTDSFNIISHLIFHEDSLILLEKYITLIDKINELEYLIEQLKSKQL